MTAQGKSISAHSDKASAERKLKQKGPFPSIVLPLAQLDAEVQCYQRSCRHADQAGRQLLAASIIEHALACYDVAIHFQDYLDNDHLDCFKPIVIAREPGYPKSELAEAYWGAMEKMNHRAAIRSEFDHLIKICHCKFGTLETVFMDVIASPARPASSGRQHILARLAIRTGDIIKLANFLAELSSFDHADAFVSARATQKMDNPHVFDESIELFRRHVKVKHVKHDWIAASYTICRDLPPRLALLSKLRESGYNIL